MTSLSPEFHGGPSDSMARSVVAEAELEGWATIAEGMLSEAILVSLTDVQEPQARADLVVECAETRAALVQWWLSQTPLPAPSASSPALATTSSATDELVMSAAALRETEDKLAQAEVALAEKQKELREVDAGIKAARDELDAQWSEQADVTDSLANVAAAVDAAKADLQRLRAEQAQQEAVNDSLRRDEAAQTEAYQAVLRELQEACVAASIDPAAISGGQCHSLKNAVHALVLSLADSRQRENDLQGRLVRAQEAEQSARDMLEDATATRHRAIADLNETLAEKKKTLLAVEHDLETAQEAQRQLADTYVRIQQSADACQSEREVLVASLEALQAEAAAEKAELLALRNEVARAADILHVPVSSPSGQAGSEAPLCAALRALVSACEESRARERQAVAELAQALETAHAYEAEMATLRSLPEPVSRHADPYPVQDEDDVVEDDDVLAVAAPTPQYRRVLPASVVNPVVASLMRVKAQARELREPSLGRLTDAIASPARRPTDGSVQTPRQATKTTASTSLAPAAPHPTATHAPALSRVLYYTQRTPRAHDGRVTRDLGEGMGSGKPMEKGARASSIHSAERSSTSAMWNSGLGATPSTSWKSKMDELQSELRSLRSDLGANK